MRAIRFRLSSELLADALHMPASAQLIALSYDIEHGYAVVTVETSDPTVPESPHPHDADPIIRWDWNLPPGEGR